MTSDPPAVQEKVSVDPDKVDPGEGFVIAGYYERWAASAARQALARGVVTAEELEARVEKLRLEGALA